MQFDEAQNVVDDARTASLDRRGVKSADSGGGGVLAGIERKALNVGFVDSGGERESAVVSARSGIQLLVAAGLHGGGEDVEVNRIGVAGREGSGFEGNGRWRFWQWQPLRLQDGAGLAPVLRKPVLALALGEGCGNHQKRDTNRYRQLTHGDPFMESEKCFEHFHVSHNDPKEDRNTRG